MHPQPITRAYAITFEDATQEQFLIFYAAAGLFLANFALGVLVQLGIVDTKPFRWLHHALFFAVYASAALAVGVGFLQGAPYRWALLPVLALFLILPRVQAGTTGHAALASLAMIFYATGLVSLL
jgi:hypothetical protein